MVHAFLVLAAEEAEKSETLFFVLGCVFAAWAVIVGALGLRSESFGSERSLSTAIIGVSVVLAAATMFAVVYVQS
ncbi:MAG TPA: hypothetical protein PKD63_13825 [Solirubrobacteraceae bacterium]|nr:hypothetical protein [Solirubrobacteraceae bacterium]